MTTYTAITSGQRDAESPIDVTLIGLMIDNPAAISEGSSGAPKILEAAINAASVSQAKLKTTTGESSTTTWTQVTLPGGEYGFWPKLRVNNVARTTFLFGDNGGVFIAPSTSDTAYIARATFGMNVGSGGDAAFIQQRYVQASPPYDLGDGEIPLFVYVIINSDGTIASTYVAPEAPWHNNGPTSIRPDLEIGGKKFQRRRAILAEFGSIKAALLSGLTRAQIMDRMATDPMINREITQAIKQADMPLIPHPFMSNNLTGKTVVLLDPVSPLMTRLLGLHDSGESVTDLVRDWMSIGNTALARSGPPGVMIVNATLK